MSLAERRLACQTAFRKGGWQKPIGLERECINSAGWNPSRNVGTVPHRRATGHGHRLSIRVAPLEVFGAEAISRSQEWQRRRTKRRVRRTADMGRGCKRCYAERTKSYYQKCDAPQQTCASYGCANVYIPYRSCHCNHWCVQFNSCCEDYQSVCTDAGLSNCRGVYDSSRNADAPCLCLFDIDRTLTGKQGYMNQCPRNQKASPEIFDDAYGGGSLTLSAFAVEGINKTFCSRCYTGVVSAGSGSNTLERELITDKILSTEKMRELVMREPNARLWTKGYIPHGGSVQSPFVRYQADREKQHAVRAIQKWYDSKGVCIPDFAVHFFGDRTENMRFFEEYPGFNSREISCKSRDQSILNGMVGLCGATPEEIVEERGIFNCPGGDSP